MPVRLWSELTDGAPDGVRRVELKFIVPQSCHDAVLTALGVDRRDIRHRRVYFFDTPALHLARRGVVVRARRARRGPDDSVVKLRRTTPVRLPGKLCRSPNLDIELDALPGFSLWSASLRQGLAPSVVRAAVTGRRPLRTLLSREQRLFFRAHAGRGVDVDELRTHGPIDVERTVVAGSASGQRMIIESWRYPDGSGLLELSAKCPPAGAAQVGATMASFLTRHGVDLTGRQRTKTSTSLEFFTRGPDLLRPAGSSPAP